jgi:hypothetical protein
MSSATENLDELASRVRVQDEIKRRSVGVPCHEVLPCITVYLVATHTTRKHVRTRTRTQDHRRADGDIEKARRK